MPIEYTIENLDGRGSIVRTGAAAFWMPPEDLVKSEIDKNAALIREAEAKIALCESMKRYFDNASKNDNVSKSSQIAMRAAGILDADIL